MSLRVLLYDFTDWSSAGGIPQIAYAISASFRIAWIVVCIALMGVGVYQAFMILTKFFSYPSIIVPALQYGAIDFPEVTICNSNPLRFDLVTKHKNDAYKDIYNWANQYAAMQAANWSEISPDDYGINKGTDRYDKTIRGRETIVLLMAALSDAELKQGTYEAASIVRNCNFNNAECNASAFSTYYDATYGACYTFNYNNVYQTQRAGSNYGLHLLMLVNQMNPKGDRLFMPTTDAAGAYISTKPKGGDPAVETYGIGAPVGQNTQIGLTYTKISRLKKPYNDCTDDDEEVDLYYPNKTYTYDLCLRVCRQKFIYEKIGCADPRYGMLPNMTKCVFENLNDLLKLRDDQNKSSPYYWDPDTMCTCKLPCAETNIATTFTLAKAPTNYFSVMNNRYVPTSYNCYTTSTFGSTNSCIAWYQQNSVVVSVYFETFDFDSLEETPSYSMSIMLNEFGGQLGLWLGFSIITIIECCCLVVMVCLYAIFGRKVVRRVNPEGAHESGDWRITDVHGLRDELDIHEYLDRQKARQYMARMRENGVKNE
uniref:Bacteriophage protein n=2 Tax=Panagrellus redivivus TaxID=6233 RepID=A0A7E4ZSQ8_PANRE